MKILLLTALLVCNYSHAHRGNHTAEQAVTLGSVIWNGMEIANHINGLMGGHTTCCGKHAGKFYHAVEVVGHSSNLVEGGWHIVEENAPPLLLSTASFGFNLFGAYAQYCLVRQRGASKLGVVLAPFSAIDFWGHIVSSYVAARELL